MRMLKITATAAIAIMLLFSGCGTSENTTAESPEVGTEQSVEDSESDTNTTTKYSSSEPEAEYEPFEEPTEPSTNNQTQTYDQEPNTTYEPAQSAPTTQPEDENPNGYDMSQYSDGSDLYDDYPDDFEDEEEAEDYYDDYGD